MSITSSPLLRDCKPEMDALNSPNRSKAEYTITTASDNTDDNDDDNDDDDNNNDDSNNDDNNNNNDNDDNNDDDNDDDNDNDKDKWYSVRLTRIKSLWKELLLVVLLDAFRINLERKNLCMITTLRSCPERSPEQEQQDYGLFYRAAYLYTYVLSGVSMPVLMPLSYAWEILASLLRSGKGEVQGHVGGVTSPSQIPVSEQSAYWISKVAEQSAYWMSKVAGIMVPVLSVASIVHFLGLLCLVLWYKGHVVSFPLRSKTPRTSWKERGLLSAAAAASVLMGMYVSWVMEAIGLGKVKPLEYWLIVVPAQMVIGIMLATRLQWKRELRQREGRLQ